MSIEGKLQHHGDPSLPFVRMTDQEKIEKAKVLMKRHGWNEQQALEEVERQIITAINAIADAKIEKEKLKAGLK